MNIFILFILPILYQDGSSFKAALLSSSPGVGKTTTATTLVCEELGFTYIEMNASDTRSKKTMEEHISHSLNNKIMDSFLTGCQISVRFGMTLILLRMLHSFSCLTKPTSHCRVIFYYQLRWWRKMATKKSFKAEYSTSSRHCCLRMAYELIWNSVINDYQYMHYWYLEKLAFQLVLRIIKIYLTSLCQWW